MQENALVTWLPHPEPWLLEEQLIAQLSLPLNLDQNSDHAFHPHLTLLRKTAKARAETAPVWNR